jgi:TMEM175 potassium channel family protein
MDRTTQRVEALTDGVFAIATTLLVLNLGVRGGLPHGEFLVALRAVGPKVLAYVVSFMVIAVYWIGHHNQFFWIRHVDRTQIWITTFFLMAIAFIPFSTSLIADYPHEVLAVLIYGTNVILAGLALLIHWRYAAGPGKLVAEPIDPRLSAITSRRILLGIVFYAIATLLAFASPVVSVLLFAGLPLFYMRSSEIDRQMKHTRTRAHGK